MIPQLPTYIGVTFGLTTLLACWLFYQASSPSATTLLVLLGWLGLQAGLALAGFYQKTTGFPPRFPFLLLPPLLLIGSLFLTRPGQLFIDKLQLDRLALLHSVRVPVELVLFWLAVYQVVPVSMTFQGYNYDILAGLTAPLVYYFGFVRGQLPNLVLIGWNFVCLGLLFTIITMGILSAPSPLQQVAFEQPNIAILYFPFVWLPSVVVPLVLVAHLATLRQLIRRNRLQQKSFVRPINMPSRQK